jgi:hypothetical protein
MVKILFFDNSFSTSVADKIVGEEKLKIVRTIEINLVDHLKKELSVEISPRYTECFIYTLPGLGNFLIFSRGRGGNLFLHLRISHIAGASDKEASAAAEYKMKLINFNSGLKEKSLNLFSVHPYPLKLGWFILNYYSTGTTHLADGRKVGTMNELYLIVKIDSEGNVVGPDLNLDLLIFSHGIKPYDVPYYHQQQGQQHRGKQALLQEIHVCYSYTECKCGYPSSKTMKLVWDDFHTRRWKLSNTHPSSSNDEEFILDDNLICENHKIYLRCKVDTGVEERKTSVFRELTCLNNEKFERKVVVNNSWDSTYTASYSSSVSCSDYLLISFEEHNPGSGEEFKFALLNFFDETYKIHSEKYEEIRRPVVEEVPPVNYPLSVAINTSIYDFHFSKKVSETLDKFLPRDLVKLLQKV